MTDTTAPATTEDILAYSSAGAGRTSTVLYVAQSSTGTSTPGSRRGCSR
jgi:hypothetical protein